MKKRICIFIAFLTLCIIPAVYAISNFQNGVASYGVPVMPNDGLNIDGNVYFVDGTAGSDGNTGTDVDHAFATITKALSFCTSGNGDTIYICAGTYTEAVSITVDDVSLIGVAAEEVGGVTVTGATDATATITITGDNVTLYRLYVTPYDAGGDMAVITATNAEYLQIFECTVTGGLQSIKITDCDYVTIENNRLLNLDDCDGGASNIKFIDSDYCTVKGNQFKNDITPGKMHGIVDNDSDHLVIIDNIAEGAPAATANSGAFVLILESSATLTVANNTVLYYAAVIAEVGSNVAVHGLGTSDLATTLTLDSVEVPVIWYGNLCFGCTVYFDTTGLTE